MGEDEPKLPGEVVDLEKFKADREQRTPGLREYIDNLIDLLEKLNEKYLKLVRSVSGNDPEAKALAAKTQHLRNYIDLGKNILSHPENFSSKDIEDYMAAVWKEPGQE